MVFCKHCGKQITDDSLYCQYCGGKQDVGLPREKECKNKQELSGGIDKFLSKLLSEKQKKYFTIYVIWSLINIICWMFGGHISNAQDCFYPFTYSEYFRIAYYDGTEFLVYVFLIPLIVLFYIKYWHTPLMSKIKEWKTKREK